MLLPNTFPSPILECPTTTAVAVTRSSGNEVPRDTTVRPITRGEIRRVLAREAAPATKRSAPMASEAKPITSVAMKSAIIQPSHSRQDPAIGTRFEGDPRRMRMSSPRIWVCPSGLTNICGPRPIAKSVTPYLVLS